MNIQFTPDGLEDYHSWKRHDSGKAARIKKLLAAISGEPAVIGKPEPLLLDLSGFWSRRIDREHRLVYKINNDTIIVIFGRYHYKK